MEEFVTDQDNRGEKTQLKVAKKWKAQIKICQFVCSKYVKYNLFFLDLLQSCWCLGLISADDEQWKEDGEQGATWKKTKEDNKCHNHYAVQ